MNITLSNGRKSYSHGYVGRYQWDKGSAAPELGGVRDYSLKDIAVPACTVLQQKTERLRFAPRCLQSLVEC
jgi:hypothetical protein